MILIGVLLFELIILIHEGGHFVTAKLFGIQVNEFALGMGPKLFGFKIGETQYSFRLLPIGGYCAMEGEDGESTSERAFSKKPVWQRMIVIVAGACMNFILGFIMMMIFLAPFHSFAINQIAKFSDDSVSSQHLKVNDTIKSINGYSVYTWMDLNTALALAKDDSLDITVERDGETISYTNVRLPSQKVEINGQERLQINLDFVPYGIPNNPGTLISQTFLYTISTVRTVWAGLIQMFTGQASLNDVAGPIGITSSVSQVTASGMKESFRAGFENLLFMMMIITVNLGVVNLLPFPALDGGRFVLLFIELIRRKPLNPKYEVAINLVGIVLLFGFILLISVKDLIQLFI